MFGTKIYPVPNRHIICVQPKTFANIRFILSFSNLYLKNHGILGKLLSPGGPIDLGYLNNDSIHTFFYISSKEKHKWADNHPKVNKIPKDSNGHPADFLILDPLGPVQVSIENEKRHFV